MSAPPYPKNLVHPSYKPAVIKAVQATSEITGRTITDYHGTPDRYPPVTVNNEDQEAQHRALGYREYGEAAKPMIAYAEYPLMMVHPEYQEAIPDQQHARKDENGAVTTFIEKGRPGKLLPVQVNNEAEEEEFRLAGYQRPGKADPQAVQAAKASPHVPGHVVQEYPKIVGGTAERPVVEDPRPDDGGFHKYPMMVGDRIVHDESEEREARGGVMPEPIAEIESEEERLTRENEELRAQLAAIQARGTEKTEPVKRGQDQDRGAKIRAGLARKKAAQAAAQDNAA